MAPLPSQTSSHSSNESDSDSIAIIFGLIFGIALPVTAAAVAALLWIIVRKQRDAKKRRQGRVWVDVVGKISDMDANGRLWGRIRSPKEKEWIRLENAVIERQLSQGEYPMDVWVENVLPRETALKKPGKAWFGR